MIEGDKSSNNGLPRSSSGGPWWKPAMEIFSEISTWIAAPIILALIAGKALDRYYGTKPTFLLVCAGVSFLISAYGIVKAVKRYAAKIKQSPDQSRDLDKGRENK